MSILTFPNTAAGLASANAVSAPRDISIDRTLIYVYDGADYTARNPPLSQDAQDAIAAIASPKLQAIKGFTPAQADTAVLANFLTLSAADRNMLSAMMQALVVLARRL